MAKLELQAHVTAPVALVYQVVADVEQYPTFLNEVQSVEKTGDVVAMTIKLGPMTTKLVNRARFNPPDSIDLELIQGPFKKFDARWTFQPDGQGTTVGYSVDYEVPTFSPLRGPIARNLIEQQTQRQIEAFKARVAQLARENPTP